MRKKDYELIARVLKANVEDGGELTICWSLAEAFEDNNPKFDRNKFLKNCGIDCEHVSRTVADGKVVCNSCYETVHAVED